MENTVPQPKDMKTALFPHQLTSVYNMEKLEKEQRVCKNEEVYETRMGIQSDPTGYGKTLSMIALILRDKMEWNLEEPYHIDMLIENFGNVVRKWKKDVLEKYPCNLILVSSSILSQWEKEVSDTPLRFHSVKCKLDTENFNPEEFDIVFVIPSMYNMLVCVHKKFVWKRFIFDEPAHIKVPGMKNLQAGFFWLITATPNRIYKKHKKCRTSFMLNLIGKCDMFTFEDNFKELIIRNNLEYVEKSYTMPVTKHYYHKCYMPILGITNGIISSRISMMIEADDIQGAITALGGKNTNNIIDIVRSQKTKEKNDIDKKIALYTENQQDKKIEWYLEKKKKVESQLQEIDNRFKNFMDTNCNICLDSLDKPVMEPQCQNLFCGKCLLLWLKDHDTCPLCIQKIKNDELVYVKTDNKKCLKSQPEKHVTKIQKTLEIIKNNENGKFLVFSTYNNTFNPICNALKDANISYARVIGSANSRDKSVSEFKSGKIKVLFLNSIDNGAGLNLQEASDIILYHSMSENIQTQILGRANRIGREFSLSVHHLEVGI